MDRLLVTALAAEDLVGAVGDHLVDIHVGLRARAGLPHDERKMLVPLARSHFAGGLDDRLAKSGIKFLKLDVRSEEHTSELESLMRISYAVFCMKQQHKNDK